MAISTTYTCDMCKATSNTPDQFCTLALSIHSFNTSVSSDVKTFHTCRKCAEKFGMLPYVQTTKPEESPSIEDLLREIMSRLQDE